MTDEPSSLWGSQRPDDPLEAPPRHDEDERPDARSRPRDPAGTQPRVDPETLRSPAGEPRLAAFTASAPAREAAPAEDDASLLPERDDEDHVGARPHGGRYTPRFQFLTGALVAVGVAALVALAALVISESREEKAQEGPAWSEWRPLPGGGSGPEQIAEHIGRAYRQSDGKQLVSVTGGPMEYPIPNGTELVQLPLQPVLRNDQGDLELVEGDGVKYSLCGLGPQCSIPSGKPSNERHLLLRREALELALYSFRYLEDVDYAVVFLPPPKGKTPEQALLIRKGELGAALARPLNFTLFQRTPNTATVARSPDTPFVQTTTLRQLFSVKEFTPGNQEAKIYVELEKLQG